MTSLVAGVAIGDPPEPMDPNVIVLPPCTDCGAQEFLNRVGSAQPGAKPGGTDDVAEHRRAVNALHAALVTAGRVTGTLVEWFATESLPTERAEMPWAFPGKPVPVVGRPDASEDAFVEFVANRRGGG